jgi:hypothetical protein
MQIAGKLQLKAQIEPNPIKVRVLSHIDQVFLSCAIYKSWISLISQGVF